MKYFDRIKESLEFLGKQPNVEFIGQAVGCNGTFWSKMLPDPIFNRHEFPVAESFQMQFSLGAALAGKCIVSIYPRMNFLLLAMGDIVNMVDKIKQLSGLNPHLIILTAIGPDSPVHPGIQHVGDYTRALAEACDTIKIMNGCLGAYEHAYYNPGQYIIIEDGRLL